MTGIDQSKLPLVVILAIFGLWWMARRGQQRKSQALRDLGLLPHEGAKPTDEQIRGLIERGEKIEAIRLYRKLHGVGLKDSKDAVERLTSEIRGRS